MKIAILGTGMVGRSIAGKLRELGHDATIGTRDVAATLARTEPGAMGTPPYSAWAADHDDVELATFAAAAAGADLVVNATAGAASIAALEAAGSQNLADKVLIDVANPLDFSGGFPPTLLVKDDDSLGEQIQRAFPNTKVVKSLSTLSAPQMVNPLMINPGQPDGSQVTVFLSGNDQQAKDTVADLLRSFGHADVLDLGDISAARGPEMLFPISFRLLGVLGPMFGFKIVR
jgi:predicted dinucleotide-binding enzyme